MSDFSIKIVTGYLIPDINSLLNMFDREYFIEYLGGHIDGMEILKYLENKDNNIEITEDTPGVVEDFFHEWIAEKLDDIRINGMRVFTWIYSSPFNNNKFIIGKLIKSFSMRELEKIVEFPVIPKIDVVPELKKFEFKTVILSE